MRNLGFLLGATAFCVAGMTFAAAGAAKAANVYIALQAANVNGGARTQVVSGAADPGVSISKGYNSWVNMLSSGDFSGADFLGTSQNFPPKDDTSLQGTTLTVWISETGQTIGIAPRTLFISYFTQNNVPSGWTITQTTYFNPNSTTPFGTAEQLASETFTAPAFFEQKATITNVTAPYTLTDEIVISLNSSADVTGDGNQSTVDISAAPIPEASTWVLFALGFAGLGSAARRHGMIAG